MAKWQNRPRVVIIGAGFGGLFAAQSLARQPVDVLLIDRQNYHTFTPLLYQVATCALDPSSIAYPVRTIFTRHGNIRFLMGEVQKIDADTKTITVESQGEVVQHSYDYLIVAAGSVTNYYGNQHLREHGYALKDLDDAIMLRNHLLQKFERAVWTTDPEVRRALTTVVVVGGGPTGLETAGALHELYNHVLRKEYPELVKARVILVEATDRLLLPYPEPLQGSALRQLESLGVQVILNNALDDVTETEVRLKNGQVIPTMTLVWTAGVTGSPLATALGVPIKKAGRVAVKQTMELIDRDCIYVVGDMAYLEDQTGSPYPMLIPVAKQQGKLAAENILRRMQAQPEHTFQYRDRGIMATIGRSRAVAWIYNRISLRGYIAWAAWLFLHLIWLLGMRNRLSVLVNWLWNYLTFDRSVRYILRPTRYRRLIE